ncbi:MAG: PorT family protein [Saprospiraceae bacterium]|nr:PorT family protein [Saprospiraceae bacterium]
MVNSIKAILILLGLWVCCIPDGNAQVRFGFKGGVGTYDLGADDALSLVRGTDEFQLKIEDARFGYHLGIALQIRLATFVIQPEVVFNSNRVDFSFQDISNPSDDIFTERYHALDIPFLFGLKAGPLRLMLGPVGHYFLDSTSELLQFEEYEQKFEDLTYGWQGGIGLDFFNLMIDIRYEGNFYRFGDHIVFNNQSFAFASKPARLLASLTVTIK